MPASPLPGAVPSPNIWHHTATYETENHAVDPDGRLWSAMRGLADWTGRTVLDLGCGTGFHLPRFAEDAAGVIGVEPHPDLLALARRRTRSLPHVTLHAGHGAGGARCPTRPSTSCTRGGPTSSVRGASRVSPSSPASCAGAAPRW